jgi:hypothetical protein
MPAPDSVLKLCETFADHRDHYRSGGYNEAQLRKEFLDPCSPLSAGTWTTPRATHPYPRCSAPTFSNQNKTREFTATDSAPISNPGWLCIMREEMFRPGILAVTMQLSPAALMVVGNSSLRKPYAGGNGMSPTRLGICASDRANAPRLCLSLRACPS